MGGRGCWQNPDQRWLEAKITTTGGHKDKAQGPAELGEGDLTWGSSRS